MCQLKTYECFTQTIGCVRAARVACFLGVCVSVLVVVVVGGGGGGGRTSQNVASKVN